jgi:hypothetical protein
MSIENGILSGILLSTRYCIESGREDLNLRPPEPHSGALPGCATPRLSIFSTVLLLREGKPAPHAAPASIGDVRTNVMSEGANPALVLHFVVTLVHHVPAKLKGHVILDNKP